jgi:protein-disulfide isomerase
MSRLHLPVSSRDHTRGPDDAAVTLVEYGDFQCPYCRQAFPIVETLLERVGDQVRFVFRHFPLTEIHPFAEHAAEIAEVAGKAGKFWRMHATLYEHQPRLDDDSLLGYAQGLGLEGDAVARDLAQGTYAEHVQADFMGGVRSGVNGTPTFFINGVRHDAAWDLDGLLEAVEAAAPARRR